MSKLPQPWSEGRVTVRPALMKVAVSPTAVGAAAVGAGIGILDHSAILAAVLASAGWAGRMVAGVVAGRRRERAARPHPAQLDPWSVPEPWRQLLQQAMSAQARFGQAVAAWPPGPTRDRLVALQPRVYQEVEQLGATARQGAAAAGWTGAMYAASRPSSAALAEEMRAVEADLARLADTGSERKAELTRREDALAAQLRAVHRAQQAEDEIQDRLRKAVARFDKTVTELLSVDAQRVAAEPSGVANALDELSDGITTLRDALAETSGPPTDTGTP